jgi:hypothetical protein
MKSERLKKNENKEDNAARIKCKPDYSRQIPVTWKRLVQDHNIISVVIVIQ